MPKHFDVAAYGFDSTSLPDDAIGKLEEPCTKCRWPMHYLGIGSIGWSCAYCAGTLDQYKTETSLADNRRLWLSLEEWCVITQHNSFGVCDHQNDVSLYPCPEPDCDHGLILPHIGIYFQYGAKWVFYVTTKFNGEWTWSPTLHLYDEDPAITGKWPPKSEAVS